MAIAAPLQGRTRTFVGKLFSTLSLHIATQEPVHVHGLFAIAPDRARLLLGDEMATKWNTFMFKSCVASAWANLLEHRNSKSAAEEGFGLWPRADTLYKPADIWTGLKSWIMDKVFSNQKAVWNSTNGSCIHFNQALFTSQNENSARYKAAWIAIGLPGVILEEARFTTLKDRAKLFSILPLSLTPSVVRDHLRNSMTVSQDAAASVLEYCLLDAISNTNPHDIKRVCSQLHGIRLWPMLNGSLEAVMNPSKALLPRNDPEMQLFSLSRPSTTLNLDKFTSKVRKFMLKYGVQTGTVARFRTLEDLALDWPTIYHVLDRVDDATVLVSRAEAQDSLLRDMWTWISDKLENQKEHIPPSMHKLWLIPISGQRVRRLAPGQNSIQALIIVKGEPLADLLGDNIAQNTQTKAALLDSKLLNDEAVRYLKTAAVMNPSLRLAVQNDVEILLEWLVAAKEGVQKLSETHKKRLLKHLIMMIRNQLLTTASFNLTEKMRQLPLYPRSVVTPPYKQRNIQRCALDCESDCYELPEGLPGLPDIEGVSFYDVSDSDEKYLVEKLGLLQSANLDTLLQRYLPLWLDNVSKTSMTATKAALVDWILRKSLSPSETWKAIIRSHQIIPMPSASGTQTYRCLKDLIDPETPFTQLYFDTENVFPSRKFFDMHKTALHACGISNGTDSPTLALDRARVFASHSADETLVQKARCLFTIPTGINLSGDEIQELRRLEWLPANSPDGKLQMYAPTQCRGVGQRHLVDLVWGTTTIFVSREWETVLGWDEDVPREVLLEQLDRCIEHRDTRKIDQLLPHFGTHDRQALAEKPCIFSAHGAYMLPRQVFSPGNALKFVSMAPYLDRVDRSFAKKHAELLATLEVKAEPSVQHLQNVQAALQPSSECQLDNAGLSIAIASLEVATQLSYHPTQFSVPDTSAILRDLANIVHGERDVTGKMAEFNFAHPTISIDLLKRLGVESSYERAVRLEIEIEDEDEDEYTPHEKLTNIICDTLGRYPIDTTFNEFLANADDAGAKHICWTIDECADGPFATQALLTPDLESLQGPALMIYNDSGE